jgi:transcriptional regulator
MTDAPQDFIDTLLKAIVGIEIEITRLEGKAKLSQNKEARDIQGAGEALAARGERLVGEAMLAAASARRTG